MPTLEEGTQYTINAFNNVVCLTISDSGSKGGITPGSPVITSFLDSPGKGGGATAEQIWETNFVDDTYGTFTNPESGLLLSVDDSGNIIVDIPADPKGPPSQQQLWAPTYDSSSGGVLLKWASNGQVITMPGGESNVQVIVSDELPEGDPGRQYQLWEGAIAQQS